MLFFVQKRFCFNCSSWFLFSPCNNNHLTLIPTVYNYVSIFLYIFEPLTLQPAAKHAKDNMHPPKTGKFKAFGVKNGGNEKEKTKVCKKENVVARN